MKKKFYGFFLLAICLLLAMKGEAQSFSLSATYHIDNSWPTGYQVTVTLQNTTSQPSTTWNAIFSLPTGQRITSFWNGVYTANGQIINVSNPTWSGGGIIPAHGSTTFGMIVSNAQQTALQLINLHAVANGSAGPPAPVPPAPVLNPISLQSGSQNSYNVSWSSASTATSYTLQQDTTSTFTSPIAVFTGNALSKSFVNQPNGTYFYRVSASNSAGMSAFSNVEKVVINAPPPVQTAVIVEGYWESWNGSDSLSSILNMHFDVLDVSFANFTTTGAHTYAISGIECDQTTLTQLISMAHSMGKKVKLSIGGATYGLQAQLQTMQDATGMAAAVAQFIQQNHMDGVDFDIEDYPAPELQIALIQHTRELLGSSAIISYTAKSPASTTYPYDAVIQGAVQSLSYISIMAYDYAPGYSYQQDISNLIAMGIPSSKIVLGLLPGYDDLGVFTSLTDIGNGANYVVAHHLGGIMFWDLNRDHENVTGLGSDAATNTAWGVIHP